MEIIYSTFQTPLATHHDTWLTIKSILDLHRSLYTVEKVNGPVESMLIYNDCIYVVHHLTSLGAQFKDFLPKGVSTGTFLDTIPFFYNIARKSLEREILTQKQLIDGCLNGNLDDIYLNGGKHFESNVLHTLQIFDRLENMLKVIHCKD